MLESPQTSLGAPAQAFPSESFSEADRTRLFWISVLALLTTGMNFAASEPRADGAAIPEPIVK